MRANATVATARRVARPRHGTTLLARCQAREARGQGDPRSLRRGGVARARQAFAHPSAAASSARFLALRSSFSAPRAATPGPTWTSRPGGAESLMKEIAVPVGRIADERNSCSKLFLEVTEVRNASMMLKDHMGSPGDHFETSSVTLTSPPCTARRLTVTTLWCDLGLRAFITLHHLLLFPI